MLRFSLPRYSLTGLARKRLDKTLADYLAIAVTPVLIMLLVGSLVFFLQELFPGERYESRVRWILFSGLSRHGADFVKSRSKAAGSVRNVYAGLAGATLAIFRFVPNAPGCRLAAWRSSGGTDKLTGTAR